MKERTYENRWVVSMPSICGHCLSENSIRPCDYLDTFYICDRCRNLSLIKYEKFITYTEKTATIAKPYNLT